MTEAETRPADTEPKRRWYQYRLRSLLLLFPLVALIMGLWVDKEWVRFTHFPRGTDHVISAPSFVIVVRGVAEPGARYFGSGIIPVGGLFEGFASHGFGHNYAEHIEYSFGTLTYCINGATFSLRRHAREVVAGGHIYRIRGKAIITIEKDGDIDVKDVSLDDAKIPQPQREWLPDGVEAGKMAN